MVMDAYTKLRELEKMGLDTDILQVLRKLVQQKENFILEFHL